MNPDPTSRRFVYYHLQNPKTWEAYEAEILRQIDAGTMAGGIKAITEKIRWQSELMIMTNDFDPYYSRLFRQHHPHHATFFEYNQSQADRIGYAELAAGDAVGALNWTDPQFSFNFGEEGTA